MLGLKNEEFDHVFAQFQSTCPQNLNRSFVIQQDFNYVPDFTMNITCVLKELEKSVKLQDEEGDGFQKDSNLDPIVTTPNDASTFQNFGSHAAPIFPTKFKTIVLLHILIAYFRTFF